MRVKVDFERFLESKLDQAAKDPEVKARARELLLNLGRDRLLELLRGADLVVEVAEYGEFTETHCYRHFEILWPEDAEATLVSEHKSTCQDGPDIWTVYEETYRVKAPAIVKVWKEADIVYGSWRKIVVLLPPH